MRALSQLKGVVFVDLDDIDPLVFLAPRDGLALEPAWTQARYLYDVRPLRILWIRGQGGSRTVSWRSLGRPS